MFLYVFLRLYEFKKLNSDPIQSNKCSLYPVGFESCF